MAESLKMVLIGFADHEKADMLIERPCGEPDHIVWSVPPQAAAGLVDRASDWADYFGAAPSREE